MPLLGREQLTTCVRGRLDTLPLPECSAEMVAVLPLGRRPSNSIRLGPSSWELGSIPRLSLSARTRWYPPRADEETSERESVSGSTCCLAVAWTHPRAWSPHDLTKSEHPFDPISHPINVRYFHPCAGAQQL